MHGAKAFDVEHARAPCVGKTERFQIMLFSENIVQNLQEVLKYMIKSAFIHGT